MSKEELVQIGKITGVHGIKGEVKVSLYGDLDEFVWQTVTLSGKKEEKVCKVTRARKHKGTFILELEGYSTRSDAETLTGLELSVKKTELPELPDGEFYYSDLIGMDVVAEDGRDMGRIANVIPTGSNDVFEVEGPLGSVLVPAIEDVVLSVDLEGRKVVVRLIEGLLPGEQ
ncbi:MAG: 16S rRNA processing protein RimM [Deltaproteobacteria bacterium]|nr:16S rRNA processing protein RimM [Deltaproteobacteria bacterium]